MAGNYHIEKEDRRTRRTKKLLANALMDLIKQKGYDSLTVQDVINKANIGRTTFYTHYESKEQLLIGNINFQDELVNVPVDDPDMYPMGINLNYFFNPVQNYLDLYKAMRGSTCLIILNNYFIDLFATKIVTYYQRKFINYRGGYFLRYQAEAAAAAIVRLYFTWLEDDAVHPAADILQYARNILFNLLPSIEPLKTTNWPGSANS